MSDVMVERLERQEKRRRRVVAAAEELRALGAGDPFEGPVMSPGHFERRYQELVHDIHIRTGYDPESHALPQTYRFEWHPDAAERIPEGGIVCDTPAGPCLVMPAGVFPADPAVFEEEIHGTEEERDARG